MACVAEVPAKDTTSNKMDRVQVEGTWFGTLPTDVLSNVLWLGDVEEGTLDEVLQMQVPSRAITIRGAEYPSMKAASKALHVRVNTVRKHRDAGTLVNVGLKKRKRR